MFNKPISVFLCAFGVIPWYSFKKNILIYPRVFKIYSILLVLFAFVLSPTFIFLRIQRRLAEAHMITIVAECLTEVGGFSLFVVTVLGSSFWNIYGWQDLFRKIRFAEVWLGANFANFYVSTWYFLANVILTILIVSDVTEIKTVVFYYTSIFVYRYCYILIAYIILSISNFLLHRYKAVNRMFHIRPHTVDVYHLKQIRNIYLDATSFAQYFNETIGWPLFFIFFYCLGDLLNIFVFVIRDRFLWGDSYYEMTKIMILVNIGYLVLPVIWLTAVVFCCDSVVRETDKLLMNCYMLEQTLPLLSKELEELDSLKELIKNKRPTLTAAGFFEIRRSTLLSLLSSTTTYFIVALQFNSL